MKLPTSNILVVEDDRQISIFLQVSLRTAGFVPMLAHNIETAQQQFDAHKPDLVILDLGLPDGEGGVFLQQIRVRSDIPVIVLSARQSEAEKVACLNLGADDYLAKPFGVDELIARIRVALRRLSKMTLRDHVYHLDQLRIDLIEGSVLLDDKTVHLSPIEYKLLMYLAQHPGRVVTHRELLVAIWGAEYVDDTHYLRIHMGRLRARIESNPAEPRYLLTELGIGYRLAAQ